MLEFRSQRPSTQAFKNLFESTGWYQSNPPSPADLDRTLENSWLCISVYNQDALVGVGRVVTDFVHAMIYDVIVAPELQGQQVGTMIMEMLVDACRRENIRDIQLFCAKGKVGFYQKLGFEARPEDAPGMQYLLAKVQI